MQNLDTGNQGSVYESTKEDFETLLDIISSIDNSSYLAIKKVLDNEKLQSFFNIIRNFVKANDIKANDKRISFNIRRGKNRLVFLIGSRYALSIEKMKDKTKLSFISNEKHSEKSGAFVSKTGIDEAYWNEVESYDGYEKIISEGLLKEINRRYRCPYRHLTNTQFIDDIYQNESHMKKYNHSLNTILYGPPGTGKTYQTIQRAAEIISDNTVIDYAQAQQIFNENLGNRIEFITFHQNYSYEDFIQGLRPDTENGNQLTFQHRDGLFTKIAINALFEYYKVLKSTKPVAGITHSDLNEVYLDFVQFLKNSESKAFDTATGLKIHISDFTKNDNIEFKHQNSSRSYLVSGNRLIKLFEVFPNIEQIKNVHNDIREAIGGCNTTVYYVALREFIRFNEGIAKNPVAEPQDDYEEVGYESKKKLLSTISYDDLRLVSSHAVPSYVIIIDEINRANISRVFGELITLIESDKRSHGDIPLQCTLPSGDEFIVPSNLYIIGTMNTADKSIALLDIALRRRFEFEAMYPIYELQEKIVYHKDVLQKINASIITRKGYDFQIGHAYFMDGQTSLEDIMNKKVIPLLLEYFMNDKKEVEGILKGAELKIQEGVWPIKIKISL
ncbi:MAG: AAA family ATPase [Saprospiraceae bacterium]|nr:AAA family ATPase [Saprospiraceae bacterium]